MFKPPTLLRIILSLFFMFLFTTCDIFAPNEDDESDTGSDIVWLETHNNTTNTDSYYVSPTGSNNANGKTAETPFKTITHALNVIRPGGTIFIMPGTFKEAIGIIGLGNDNSAITIKAYSTPPVMDGENSLEFALFFEECKNIHIDSLVFKNYTDFGFGASICTNLSIKNSTLLDNGHKVQLTDWELEGYGIHIDDSEHILIERNIASKNGPKPQRAPHYLMGTGINTYGNKHVIIRNNKSFENIGGGILVEDSEDVLVENNEIYKNDLDATADEWWDGGIWLDGGENVTLRNNLIYENLGPGIEISDEDRQNPTGYVLEGNTSRDNYYGIFIWNFGTKNWPDSTVIANINNQFTNNSRQDVWIEDWY